VFGGTFDPIHNAHLDIAEAALEQAKLDRVLFVVSARPPHKGDSTQAPPEARFAMVNAALAHQVNMEPSRVEMDREGPSYMVDTLETLREENPDADLFLIVGMDSLIDLPNWYKSDGILKRARLLVVPRPGDAEPPKALAGHYDVLNFDPTDLSSTEVREHIIDTGEVPHTLPHEVVRYILDMGIYLPAFDTPRAGEFVALLHNRLPERTVRHVLSVTRLMETIAEGNGLDREKAINAGLLHDLCKAVKGKKLLERAEEYGLDISDAQRERPKLLHGPVAAEESRRDLGVSDEDVYEAVYWHTTGKPNFGPLGLALYVADFAEEFRPHEAAVEARDILRDHGFNAALRFVAERKREQVLAKAAVVEPTTEAFFTWLTEEHLV
jgi:nicotinate-nucleotide adenylyltransferase